MSYLDVYKTHKKSVKRIVKQKVSDFMEIKVKKEQ
jgi:hypothetical protein